MGGCALGESVGAEVVVGTRVAAGDAVAVPMGGCTLGATVAVGDGAAVEVAVGTAVGVPVGVSVGVKAGPVVEVGGGIFVGLLGEQAAASSPAAKVLKARRKLRRETGLAGEERPT